jgi:hypothetical protein
MCAHKGSIETLDYLIASGADFNIADRWVLVLFQMCNFVVSVALVESTSVSYLRTRDGLSYTNVCRSRMIFPDPDPIFMVSSDQDPAPDSTLSEV